MGSAPGASPAQIRTTKASFEQQYGQLPSPQWRLLGEALRSADAVLSGLEDRQRRDEAAQAAASAAEADRRLQQVRAAAPSGMLMCWSAVGPHACVLSLCQAEQRMAGQAAPPAWPLTCWRRAADCGALGAGREREGQPEAAECQVC